jgi:xanthine dehydrogenase YagS FAD-binding subunit
VEEAIKGRRLDSITVAQAAEAAVKHVEPLEQNGYRVSLFRGLIEEERSTIAKV